MCGQCGGGRKTSLDFLLQKTKERGDQSGWQGHHNWGCNEYGDSEAQGCSVLARNPAARLQYWSVGQTPIRVLENHSLPYSHDAGNPATHCGNRGRDSRYSSHYSFR